MCVAIAVCCNSRQSLVLRESDIQNARLNDFVFGENEIDVLESPGASAEKWRKNSVRAKGTTKANSNKNDVDDVLPLDDSNISEPN